jgi:biotin synthase-like enzyme|tara:strand:- start:407 stop:1345 length:939 start_codon:yes stop_codon:yes gene_type:complete
MKSIHFERAIFINWYCSKRDCAFCYLASKKNQKQDPNKAKRTKESILAEAIICKACNWPIEFISGGCDCQSDEEILEIIKNIYKITNKKLILNLGTLTEKQIKLFKPYIEGVCGTVEIITPKLRDQICPSKPLSEIKKFFKLADKYNLKKTVTIVLGIGETLCDIENLKEFLKEHNVERITFYRLKPQKETPYEDTKPITSKYYTKWVKEIRKDFPNIKIITGSWLTHLNEINQLLKAGSDGITKFPSIKKFNSKYAKQIVKEVKKANMLFKSNFTKKPKINIEKEVNKLDINKELKDKIKIKLNEYLKNMN